MPRPDAVLRHARRQVDQDRPHRFSVLPLIGAIFVTAAVFVSTLTPSGGAPVSLGGAVPVAMTSEQLANHAEYNSYYARRLGHRMAESFGYRHDYQWTCLRRLWRLESSWRVHADNPYSSAYGIPQAMPGRKMSSAGTHWRRNAETQIRWGLRYVRGRYNGPCPALRHKHRHGWY